MKTTLFLLSLLVISTLITGCSRLIEFARDANTITPSDVIITETREVSGFTAIDMSTIGKVIISQGDSESLTITGSDNLVPLVKTTVKNGVLVIEMKNNVNVLNFNRDKQLTFTINVKDLTALMVSGLGAVEMETHSTTGLAITMSGAGQVTLGQLNADNLQVTVSGLGNVKIAGEVTQAGIDLSGAGGVEAADLKISTVNINIPGLGRATVWVTDQLTGSISGSGSISYYGDPQTDVEITGLGTLKAMGSK